VVKGFLRVGRRLDDLRNRKADDLIPFSHVDENNPWHGCKFAAMAVLHIVSETNISSKQDAVRPISNSLGGCKIQDQDKL
jgi:hypothetical protein